LKTIDVLKWLLDAGLKQVDIARRARVCLSSANRTIHGSRNCPLVKKALVAMGCPRDLVYDKEKAA
jgi:hypothetical protein